MAARSEYKTSQTYLSRHYFDDAKLREFAIDEFMRCMRSRKMVAFVGSMASNKLGYPDWKGLFDLTIRATKEYLVTLELGNSSLLKNLDGFAGNLRNELDHNQRFDGRVLASVLGLWVDNATLRDDSGDRINEGLARLLETERTRDQASYAKESSIISNLKADLGIKNFITTNYDLEIEFVVNGCEQPSKSARYAALRKVANVASTVPIPFKSLLVPASAIDVVVGSPSKVRIDAADLHRIDTESISIKLPDGNQMVTDAFNRDRLDRLIEFSIGSADIDFHILHLHGHVWRPRSMIVSYRDYDRLYRRSGASKHPFEQTLSLLYSSNPIVFVGLGMGEGKSIRHWKSWSATSLSRGRGDGSCYGARRMICVTRAIRQKC